MATIKQKIGFLLMVILTASIYIQMDKEVKLLVDNTKSTFFVWENEKFVISGIETNKLYNGSKLVTATSRIVTNSIIKNMTNLTRTVNFGKSQIIDNYQFNGNEKDVELFPIEETHQVINGTGLIYQYQVTKLIYKNGNKDIKDLNAYSFGRKMKIEWEGKPYFAKITQQINGFGTLTLKYRIASDNEIYKIRLFDPPINITLYLNGTNADRFYELGDPINITTCANVNGTTVFINTTHPSLTNPIANGTMSITDNICYQETANVSTACGGLATGSYNSPYDLAEWYADGQFPIIDGDWDTGQYFMDGFSGELNITYKKPNNSSSDSLWQVKDWLGIQNLSLSSCWNANSTDILLNVLDNGTNHSATWSCWNGTTFINLRQSYENIESISVKEEAIWWNIGTTTTGCATYLWNNSNVVINQFNDSATTQNHSANNISGITINSVTDLQYGSMYLRGYNTIQTITTNITNLADTYIDYNLPNNNYGSSTTMIIQRDNSGVLFKRVFMDFDTSSISQTSNISDASLNIYLGSWGGCPCNESLLLYNTTNNWSETGITWNNQPVNQTLYSSIKGNHSGWYSFNITNLIISEVQKQKTNVSFVIRWDNELNATATLVFDTKEGTNKPYLTVVSNNTVYPNNLSIAIETTQVYWLPYMTLQDTYAITDRFKTNTLIKNLTFSRSGTNVTYVQAPCNSQANALSWNVSGGNGTQNLNKVDNLAQKSLVFSTENSSNTFNLYLPKSSTVATAPVNITLTGSPYYTEASPSTLSGGYNNPMGESSTTYKTTASKAYSGTSVYLYGASYLGLSCGTRTMTLSFVADSGTKASCTSLPTYLCNVYWSYYSCNVNIGSDINTNENVWVTVSSSEGEPPARAGGLPYAATYFSGLNQYDTNNATNITIWQNGTNLNYQFLGELNTSNPQNVNLSSANMNSYLTTCTQDSCPVPYTMKTTKRGNVTISGVNVDYTNSISNITYDVANDGVVDASISGASIPNNNITIGQNGLNMMNTYISGHCVNNSVSVPIVATSETAGTMSLSNLVGNFSINPITLNVSTMNLSGTGNIQVPIKYTADNWGILNTYGLSINALTDYNYSFTGWSDSINNATQTVKLIWSNFSMVYPNGVSYFRFKPSGVNATNVTPVGQTDTIPMFNITGLQREQPFDIYVKFNATPMSSINFSVGNSSNISFSYIMNNTNTFVKTIRNVTVGSTVGLWFWQDFFNVNSSALRVWKWNVSVEAKCSECV